MSYKDFLINWLGGVPKDKLEKGLSVIPEYGIFDEDPKPRIPKWNLADLYDKSEKSWQLQQIFRTMIQEVKRPGWEIKPRYKLKCKKCQTEIQNDVDECPICKSKRFDKPDPDGLVRAKLILRKPNSSRQTFTDVLTSIIYHTLVSDNCFLSIAYAPTTIAYIPKEIYIEDPSNIKIVADNRGRLGENEWFCPICYPEESQDVKNKPGKCKVCGGQLVKTYYVQILNNVITNRFGLNQMVHSSANKILPSIYGAPRLASAWNIINILEMMDQWFYDTYSEGKLAKIINFPGYSQQQVSALAKNIAETNKLLSQYDTASAKSRPKRSPRNLMIASDKPIQVSDVMPNPADMQMMEYYQMGIAALCGIYGAQPIFLTMAAGASSKGGNTPFLQIDVHNRTIEEMQNSIESMISDQLFPIFGIKDWVLKFGDLEKKDESRDAQIMQTKANTAQTLINAGFKIEINDAMEIIIKDPKPKPIEQMRPVGPTEEKDKISESSGQEIKGTTRERPKEDPRGDSVT